MRLRVLLPLLVAGAIAIIAILTPAALAYSGSRTQSLVLQRSGSLDQITQLGELAMQNNDADGALSRYLLTFSDVYGEAVAVVDASGVVLAASGGIDDAEPEFTTLARAASRNLPQLDIATLTPWSPETTLIAEPILTSGETAVGAVILQVDLTTARAEVRVTWLLIAALGLALLLALAVAALRWTRWVLRPVELLDEAANDFPARQIAPEVATGPPELRRLVRSFARMGAGVERTLVQQRAFVADASHQLRNPLAAVRLRIDGLRLDAEDHREFDEVDRDLDRLQATLSRMLDLATAEHRATVTVSGAREDHRPPRRSHTVASTRALVEPFRRAMEQAGQTLTHDDGGEVMVACPRSDLEEIVANLLDNARKYAGRGATVNVQLRAHDGESELEVTDNGPGLSEDDLAAVGQRFWRSAAHRGQPGTGLGLAIVEQLARANGGSMEVTRAPAGGLRVLVHFRADG